MAEVKYWGTKKIIGVEKTEVTTLKGTPVVKLITEKSLPFLISETALKKFASDNPIKEEDFNRKRIDEVLKSVTAAFMEDMGDITGLEFDTFGSLVVSHLRNIQDKAAHFRWHGNVENWIPGTNFLLTRSLLDSEDILRHVGQKTKGTKEKKAGN